MGMRTFAEAMLSGSEVAEETKRRDEAKRKDETKRKEQDAAAVTC
jgi:hypothetical protein